MASIIFARFRRLDCITPYALPVVRYVVPLSPSEPSSSCSSAFGGGRERPRFPQPDRWRVMIDGFVLARSHQICLMPDSDIVALLHLLIRPLHCGSVPSVRIERVLSQVLK